MTDSCVASVVRSSVAEIRYNTQSIMDHQSRREILIRVGRTVLRATDGIRDGVWRKVELDIEETIE